ncbi:MAG: energy-coupled thiamine transporter ThiT [Candidatus Bathyarchaeia archaeon]
MQTNKPESINQSSKYQKSFKNPRVLAEMAIFIALGTALSFIIIYTLPQGGSITLASMVPIIWLSLRRGPKVGITAGVIYGLIQFAALPYIAPVPDAIIQVLLDYPLAFGVLGLSGFFPKYPVLGAAVGISGRFIMHFVAGVFYWGPVYAPTINPYVYSAVYNGSYLLPELIISGVALYLLQKSKVLRMYM